MKSSFTLNKMNVCCVKIKMSIYRDEVTKGSRRPEIHHLVKLAEFQSRYFCKLLSLFFPPILQYLFFLFCNRSSLVSLEWHWADPSRIDWSSACSHVCQLWIICNDVRSISRGLAVCIHWGKWTAQSKEALEKLVITGGRALTQNTVPLT